MKYNFIKWNIKELIDLYDNGKINLSPPYQRNFIWTKKDQEQLMNSIIVEFPLPTFFFFQKDDVCFDIVDGQQRTRTILKFVLLQRETYKSLKK